MTKFERAVKIETLRLRDLFAKADLPSLHFRVQAHGSIDHGDIEVKFTVGTSDWSDGNVTANSVEAALDEFLRRKGWKAAHDCLLLSHMDSERDDA